jgi:hypothetical protein
MAGNSDEREWKTRKKRIDPRLDALGWKTAKGDAALHPHRTEEEETDSDSRSFLRFPTSSSDRRRVMRYGSQPSNPMAKGATLA